MRFALIYPAFLIQRSGINKSMTLLANWLAQAGHEVWCIHKNGRKPLYRLDTRVNLLEGEENFASCKTLLRNCDAAAIHYAGAEAEWGLNLMRGINTPLLMKESHLPWVVEQISWNRKARMLAFSRAQAIQLLESARGYALPQDLALKTFYTNVPISMPNISYTHDQRENSTKWLVAAGRLDDIQKRFGMLIEAFSILAPEFPDWNLVIYGDGLFKEYYLEMLAQLHLQERVKLGGSLDNLESSLAQGDIFVMPSAFESFGRALAEACAVGLPGVGFAACCGVNEIIIDGKNGILVKEETAAALAQALACLMRAPELRERLGKEGKILAQRYASDTILPQWENILCATAASAGNVPSSNRPMGECDFSVSGGRRNGGASYGTGIARALRAKFRNKSAKSVHS